MRQSFLITLNIQKQTVPIVGQNLAGGPVDTGTRRKLFAGFRPLSAFARGRIRSQQHRSISLPESNY